MVELKKDYAHDCKKLLNALGGKENIKKFFHFMTRLRFYLEDKYKINESVIKELPKVSGINWHQDQLQEIVGNDVNEMYKGLLKLGVSQDDNDRIKGNESRGLVSKIIVCDYKRSIFF